jgi:hypothetical protein
MATTISSDFITDREDGQKQVQKHQHGTEKIAIAHKATGGALTDNSVIHFVEIPVDASISSIRLWSDDHGTTGDMNLGFYPGNIAPGDQTVADTVDEDALATAVDINAAALADTELRFEVKDINTMTQKAWELAGLSAKPDYGTFFISGTLSEATTADGDLSIVVRYIS